MPIPLLNSGYSIHFHRGAWNNPLRTIQHAFNRPPVGAGQPAARTPFFFDIRRSNEQTNGAANLHTGPSAGQDDGDTLPIRHVSSVPENSQVQTPMLPALNPNDVQNDAASNNFPARQYQRGDLVYGVERGPHGERGRKHYINTVFKCRADAARIDDFRVLEEEQGKPAKADAAEEGRFRETLGAHAKYASASGASSENNSALRRKAKGGLYWATMVEHKHVHFVLDAIDIAAVIKKSHGGRNPDFPQGASNQLASNEIKNRAVVGAELRWLYRNRNNSAVAQHVHFWIRNQPCRPPWEEYVTTRLDISSGAPRLVEERHDVVAMWAQYASSKEGMPGGS